MLRGRTCLPGVFAVSHDAANGLKVYLAGPLFSQAERAWNRRLAEQIAAELGGTVLLPQDFPAPDSCEEEDHHSQIFRLCLEGVDACDVVVAILDGPDVDSGTAFEMGYAYALRKPAVGIRTDFRKLQDRGTNLMLSRSCQAFVHRAEFGDDLAELAHEVCRQVRSIADAGTNAARGDGTGRKRGGS
jgi:nucleoside 2-deoxyribosyltransferase